MQRLISWEAFKHERFLCDFVACYPQEWKDRATWTGYDQTPRFADGMLIPTTQGSVILTTADGQELHATKGDLLYVPKGSVYRISFRHGAEAFRLYTVNFCLKDGDGQELRMAEAPTLWHGILSEECRYLAEALSAVFVRHAEHTVKQQAGFFALLDRILDAVTADVPEDDGIGKGIRLLNEEWRQSVKFSTYARLCGMSESEFYRAFSAQTGSSPHAYRTSLRMTAAKTLLADSALTVGEIAKEVGYDDPYYFSRLFRSRTGISPRAYRKQYQQ